MKIDRVEIRVQNLELREPYAIAYETTERVDNVFVMLHAGRWLGLGSAAPDPAVTGESVADTVRVLEDVAAPRLRGATWLRRAALMADLARELGDNPSALAAVDLALHDLLGKRAGLPLWQILGGFRDRIATSVTIGILDLDETVRLARKRVACGFRHLKLKGGRDVEGDIARVLAVRRAVGDSVGLRFDANQGFTVEESVHFVTAVNAARLELIEQPTAREDPRLLGEVTAAVDLPVMADESLVSLRDAFRLAENDRVDMVNIKLMKVGGIARAQRVDAVAQSARLESMVGCMDESAVSIAGALAFALSSPNVEYADLDGHLDLLGDPAAGALPVVDGFLHGPTEPGLGVAIE
jgi:L-alanine-DL-glutamate epimerase-like enolase superfamily enzyme